MGDCTTGWPTAIVLPFVPRRPQSTLTVSERIQAMYWMEAARAHGVRDMRIYEPESEDDPALGGFMLVYRQDSIWAAWGIAARGGRYEVWRAATGVTIGWFGDFAQALAAIQPVG